MFERFTDRARRSVVVAQEEARGLGHRTIGTEHLLLGMIRVEECVAARVLAAAGVTEAEVRGRSSAASVGADEARTPTPTSCGSSASTSTPSGSRSSAPSVYIGTEHVLLALLRLDDGLASRILADRVRLDDLRREVLRVLGKVA